MNLVQRVKGDQVTFGDVATTIVSMARDNAIKNCERILSGGEAGHQLQSATGTQLLRQWRRFLIKHSQ